jgi:hypothetical protein
VIALVFSDGRVDGSFGGDPLVDHRGTADEPFLAGQAERSGLEELGEAAAICRGLGEDRHGALAQTLIEHGNARSRAGEDASAEIAEAINLLRPSLCPSRAHIPGTSRKR